MIFGEINIMTVLGGLRSWFLVCWLIFDKKIARNIFREIPKISLSPSYKHRPKFRVSVSGKNLWFFDANELFKHNSETRNEFYAQFHPGNKFLVTHPLGGPLFSTSTHGKVSTPWEGHKKLISRVKLGVEFFSGIRIVFKQFISGKNRNVFELSNFRQCM